MSVYERPVASLFPCPPLGCVARETPGRRASSGSWQIRSRVPLRDCGRVVPAAVWPTDCRNCPDQKRRSRELTVASFASSVYNSGAWRWLDKDGSSIVRWPDKGKCSGQW